ncbi:MAG: AraC family transcriptional regulator [Eubacterium sp.]|jgi:transcriptional regulator, araC family|uniref:AraC family transcriptional regulator n=1 Tax=Eubacterium sp. TaxID=142586 RepID=UPI0039924E2E
MDKKEIITESLVYIEKNLKQKISIEEIADYVGYSKFYFSRMFKQEMNISIMEYVKERKVICALESILQGNKILDVAIEYGWESHSGFIKAFKSYYGFSPSLLYAMNLEIIHLGGRNMRNYAFYEKNDEHMSKEDLFKLLERKMTENKLDTTELGTVYNFCQKSYANKKRYSGDEYITHLLNVSLLLVQIGSEVNVVYAGMFCDVFRKTDVLIDDIKKYLPKDVAQIIIRLRGYDIEKDGLKDEECAVIKMAERLHNMRTIEYMEESEKKRRAKETISIFMPVARKLKNEKVINELNNLSIKYVV